MINKDREAYRIIHHALQVALVKADNTVTVERTYTPALAALEQLQAACDRYAPKLSEAEAVAKAADAIHAVIHQAVVEPEPRRMKRAAEAALRAAGMRFKEEV